MVNLSLYNPLSMELKVASLSLLSEGTPFLSPSASFTIPPSSTFSVQMEGKPESEGEITFSGEFGPPKFLCRFSNCCPSQNASILLVVIAFLESIF